ncbi:MAG: hypothetical protein H7Y88_10495, partial [Phycisphaerales bacterium]|nr:hypothetical protein [Phycisphaerales bacterium]
LGPRPAAPSLASAPLELAPAPTAEAGAIVTPSAPSISDECEALLTLLGSDRSTREELLAARRGLRDLLDRGPCARLGISRRQHELARLYLAPFG